MAYTNSPLVSYTKLSPNHSGQRTHSIDRITPHCVVGQATAERIAEIFTPTSRQASCNYGIGYDGRISLVVEEKNRSWCSSSKENDQRAITIEVASDTTAPYAFKDAAYTALINLCIDICKRNGKKKLLWLADKAKTLAYDPASDEMLLSVHRWFANKSCPGDWMYARMGDLASKVTAALGDETVDVSVADTNLKQGSTGDAVKTMQTMLIACGFSCGSTGADGDFGKNTLAGLIAFQNANGLTADGKCGPKTLAALGVNVSETSQSASGDVELLARLISAEARGEPYTGQVAVGAVVLNRVESPSFPNTMSGVIYQSGAFTCLQDGQFWGSVADSAYKAARDALNGWDPSGGAIYYYNPNTATSAWIWSRPVITVIGKHKFCA
mgnify:CR=1 FL=1